MAETVFPPSSHLSEQFDTPEQQYRAANLGMWCFLATEVLFFGGLILGFIVYAWLYRDAFVQASGRLSIVLGGINTAVLLTSSLTLVLAIHAAQNNRSKKSCFLLAMTALLGIVFLGIKAVEYTREFHEHLFPGAGFDFTSSLPKTAALFFFLYFMMTALHALHLTIGISLVCWMALRARRKDFSDRYFTPLELTGLYWHFVDIVWVFLFPLLYLMERKS